MKGARVSGTFLQYCCDQQKSLPCQAIMTHPHSSVDPAIERAYNWFQSFQTAEEWVARKQSIEADLKATWQSADSSRWDIEFFRHVCQNDRFG